MRNASPRSPFGLRVRHEHRERITDDREAVKQALAMLRRCVERAEQPTPGPKLSPPLAAAPAIGEASHDPDPVAQLSPATTPNVVDTNGASPVGPAPISPGPPSDHRAANNPFARAVANVQRNKKNDVPS